MIDYTKWTPQAFRQLIREGKHTEITGNCCAGYTQANLVVLPREYAEDFKRFCQRNPKPCPILEILEPGEMMTKFVADDANIATDFPMYVVYENGEVVEETTDVSKYWRDDLVSFLIGCSMSFEEALIEGGVEIRNITDGHTCSTYVTQIPCAPAGDFEGALVCTMRPVHKDKIDLAYEITGAIPHVHGCPVYHGDPATIGVDLSQPKWGIPSRFEEDEVPVFWACGVTPQIALANAKPSFAITHKGGHMLVCDIPSDEIEAKLVARERECTEGR